MLVYTEKLSPPLLRVRETHTSNPSQKLLATRKVHTNYTKTPKENPLNRATTLSLITPLRTASIKIVRQRAGCTVALLYVGGHIYISLGSVTQRFIVKSRHRDFVVHGPSIRMYLRKSLKTAFHTHRKRTLVCSYLSHARHIVTRPQGAVKRTNRCQFSQTAPSM